MKKYTKVAFVAAIGVLCGSCLEKRNESVNQKYIANIPSVAHIDREMIAFAEGVVLEVDIKDIPYSDARKNDVAVKRVGQQALVVVKTSNGLEHLLYQSASEDDPSARAVLSYKRIREGAEMRFDYVPWRKLDALSGPEKVECMQKILYPFESGGELRANVSRFIKPEERVDGYIVRYSQKKE